MSRKTQRAALLLPALLMALGAHAQADKPPVVTLGQGSLQGQGLSSDVAAFKGIPYAAAPTGELRWRPPQPAPHWHGTRVADRFGTDCPQPAMDHPPGPGYVNATSENCLFVNVWTPRGPAPAGGWPVMVWIHGGAWIMGAGSWPVYDGSHFARQGIVLVTLNYRLGHFGFLAHPALSREQPDAPLGNYGLLDQIAALKWVHGNIHAFGGDSANVTIFGESGGGRSVNMLLTSPLAKGLFAKAISQSGGGQNMLTAIGASAADPASGQAQGLAWSRSLGLPDDVDVAHLRALPEATVAQLDLKQPLPAPMVDGRVLAEQVDTVMREGRQTAVPYLVGSNSHEESLLRWMPPDAAQTKWKQYAAFAERLRPLYTQQVQMPEDALKRWWGEASYVAPSRYNARLMARKGVPVWRYSYGYVPVTLRATAQGADHGTDEGMVFGNDDVINRYGYSAADARMAGMLNRYWAQFARTGDPNQPGLPDWPRTRSQTDDTLLRFSNDSVTTERHFGGDRLDLLDQAYEAMYPLKH